MEQAKVQPPPWKVWPKNEREARVWHFVNNVQDWFWSFLGTGDRPVRWPEYLVEMFLKEHKDHRERYRLFLFLTFNGMKPEEATSWVTMADYRDGQMVMGDYDKAAWSQFFDMMKKAREKTLFTGQRAAIMDMLAGYPQ